MNRSKYIYLSLTLLLTISLAYFSSKVEREVVSKPTQAQTPFSCSDVQLNTLSGESTYTNDSIIELMANGTPRDYQTKILLNVISDQNSEAIYDIPTYISPGDNSVRGNIDVSELRKNISLTDLDFFFLIYTKIYDESGNLICNGKPTIAPTDPSFCPHCAEFIAISSSDISADQTPDTLGVVKAQEEPTPTPTPTPIAYFRVDYPPDPETFIIKLTRQSQIDDARDMLAGTSSTPHVGGIVYKWPASDPGDYNQPWSWHLKEDNIVFFSGGPDSCDASIRFIEDNLADLEIYLGANLAWCPLESRIIEEVEDPFSNQCSYLYNGDANGDGKATGNDFAFWAYYFDPFTRVEGFESVGDFNCDGFVNGNDFAIWAYHFTPF